MVTMDKKDKALPLYLEISEQLENHSWYSTQTTGYALMALGRFINKYYKNNSEDVPIAGTIIESNGLEKNIESNDLIINVDLIDSFGDKAVFTSTSRINELFVTLNWSGVPMEADQTNMFEGLKIQNTFRDKKGNIISPEILKQGDIFTQSITVTNLSNIKLENLALVQILPSGWEIENERMEDDKKLKKKKRDYRIDYIDIRDDRQMWFFKLARNKSITLEFKLRAVTAGEFVMPATYCEAMYDNKYKARKAGMNVKVSTNK